MFLVTFPLSGLASDFMVNTCNAGSGALSVTIDGPSKVKMDFQECPEGYKVSYTPTAPGNYLISIKYGGPQHIVGSPFKAKVTGEPLFRCCQTVLIPAFVVSTFIAIIKKLHIWVIRVLQSMETFYRTSSFQWTQPT